MDQAAAAYAAGDKICEESSVIQRFCAAVTEIERKINEECSSDKDTDGVVLDRLLLSRRSVVSRMPSPSSLSDITAMALAALHTWEERDFRETIVASSDSAYLSLMVLRWLAGSKEPIRRTYPKWYS